MARGPQIRPEEVSEAHKLKAEGNKLYRIAEIMKRSEPTIRKMLRLPTEIKEEQPS